MKTKQEKMNEQIRPKYNSQTILYREEQKTYASVGLQTPRIAEPIE